MNLVGKLWLAVLWEDGFHGFWICTNHAKAMEKIYAFVEKRWQKEMKVPIPLDRDAAVRLYFDEKNGLEADWTVRLVPIES